MVLLYVIWWHSFKKNVNVRFQFLLSLFFVIYEYNREINLASII
jgi:hypothetical protein